MVPHSSHSKSCGYRWRIRAIVKPERSRRLIGVTNHVGAAISREKRPARQQAGRSGCAVSHSGPGETRVRSHARRPVRLISRNDASLVVGLIAGTIVIFQRPLRFVWEAGLDVQERYHVDLLPALTIFAGVFIFHEARKRQQAKAAALAAAAEALQARMRSAELERLMTFSQALANALDPATLSTLGYERDQHVLRSWNVALG